MFFLKNMLLHKDVLVYKIVNAFTGVEWGSFYDDVKVVEWPVFEN